MRHTQRLIALGDYEPQDIALAVAQDALALIDAADHALVTLRPRGARRIERRAARHAESSPLDSGAVVELPIRSGQGRVGTIALWLAVDAEMAAPDQFALVALTWLAAAAVDRLALREAEAQWQREKRRLDATFSAAPVGIAHVAPDGTFLAVNERFAAICGRTRADLVAGGFQAITHPDDLDEDLVHVRRLLSGKSERYRMEKRYLLPDGSATWVNLTVALIRDTRGEPDFFVSVIEDISDVRRARAEASRDPLTGLLNRRGLLESLQRDLVRCAQTEQPFTLVYVDFDAFKQVNDRHGHARGDACLTLAANALARTVGSWGRVARVGGDEFVIALPGSGVDTGTAMVRRLRAALRRIEVAPGWHLSASFGRITVQPDTDLTAAALIAAADTKMFRDKRRVARMARARSRS
ncbi:MAG: diguanylate cyclase [Sphingomonas sp.]|nr:diguanylate cyclase [Sphingomonas sp.]